jgi:hypothetical protein
MLLQASVPLTCHYSVEVSGWDVYEEFFVEKAELEWNERGKFVVLQRMLPDGAYVFVRLLQDTSVERSQPVAYAAHFERSRPGGQRQFRLTAVHPRIMGTAQRGA